MFLSHPIRVFIGLFSMFKEMFLSHPIRMSQPRVWTPEPVVWCGTTSWMSYAATVLCSLLHTGQYICTYLLTWVHVSLALNNISASRFSKKKKKMSGLVCCLLKCMLQGSWVHVSLVLTTISASVLKRLAAFYCVHWSVGFDIDVPVYMCPWLWQLSVQVFCTSKRVACTFYNIL